MRSIFFALVLAVAAFGHAVQEPSARDRKSAEILTKIRQVDLLNQLLPVSLSKEQINKLLPVIEKCRQLVRKQEEEEANLLLTLEKEATEAVNRGIEKQDVPDAELLVKFSKAIAEMSAKRQNVITANVIAVTTVFEEVCNKGQIRTAANSLNPRLINPNLKIEELTEEVRLNYWIQEVLLDPRAYDLLVRMAKALP
jgi:hypothetical protein